jgi:hypothetical protein
MICPECGHSWKIDNVAGYTRAIMRELEQHGLCRVLLSTYRPDEELMRSRIYNAALRLGVKVRTRKEGNEIIGEVIHHG